MPEEVVDNSEDYSDEEGESAVEWQELPPDRDFFASPYDPPIKALVQDIREHELIVRPTFQHNQVWDAARKGKFIESILLNIPIPSLFFADDEDKKVVVDGQQRLLALKEYLDNAYQLRGLEVLAALNGKRFDQLTDRQQRIINNRTLRCLVISAKSDSEIRFQVFERLNQGGVPLNAQEVRHCVYRGELNDLLHEVVALPDWLRLYGRTERHPRMVDCELVLRFFAIRHVLPNYTPPLKRLLTNYMKDHRHPEAESLAALRESFASAVQAVSVAFPEYPFRRFTAAGDGGEYDRNLNRAVFDIQMLTLSMIEPSWLIEHHGEVDAAFRRLCTEDSNFSDSVSRATADKKRFEYRLSMWAKALQELGAELDRPDLIPDTPPR